MRCATKHVYINHVEFWVRVSTKVTLSQDQNTCCPMRLKLVKSSGNDVEAALFSDSNHTVLKVGCTRDPNAIDVTYQVLHNTHLRVAYFIYN